MLSPSDLESNEETRSLPRILRTADDERAIARVELSALPYDERRDAVPTGGAAAHGLTQMLGLDVRAAVLTIIVDLMIFSGDIASLGILVPSAVAVATALSYIVYKIQLRWYGDDQESAFIKAMIIGLLTAIPVPLSPFLAVPGGIVGIVNAVKRR